MTIHPLLVELRLSSKSSSSSSSSPTQSGAPTSPTSTEILSFLLHQKIVTEEHVRSAYQTLLKEINRNEPSSTPVPPHPQPPTPKHSSPEPTTNRTRHIALRFYYNGEDYTGLAENMGIEQDRSVERALFAALQKAKMIDSRATAGYSRCGRTDRGVSAAGQVVALHLKSAFRLDATWDAQGERPLRDEELPKNASRPLEIWLPPRTKSQRQRQQPQSLLPRQQRTVSEYAYDKILNNLLPKDIRILGWSPVSKDFSARFSATTRTYRYFFVKREMDLDLIQEGLDQLVGDHDFRNFCKMDVEKVYNFQRKIYSARVVIVEHRDAESVCYLQIVGQAFLWHQIRCIATIVFLVGRGLEHPSIVSELLDVVKHPGKPSYPLADERHLVLHDCGFRDLNVGYHTQNLYHVHYHLQQQWDELILAAARIQNCIASLAENLVLVEDLNSFCVTKIRGSQKKNVNNNDNGSFPDLSQTPAFPSAFITWRQALQWMKDNYHTIVSPDCSTHIPLLERARGTTYDEKIEALNQSSRRWKKYEENVVKKRKTKDEDAAFYMHKMGQGGSGM